MASFHTGGPGRAARGHQASGSPVARRNRRGEVLPLGETHERPGGVRRGAGRVGLPHAGRELARVDRDHADVRAQFVPSAIVAAFWAVFETR